jgi:hypothetical protein
MCYVSIKINWEVYNAVDNILKRKRGLPIVLCEAFLLFYSSLKACPYGLPMK